LSTHESPNGRPDIATREELSLLVDSVQDYAIILLGPHGDIRSWNLGATRIMGYEPFEAIGKNFSIFYLPDDIAARKPERELVAPQLFQAPSSRRTVTNCPM